MVSLAAIRVLIVDDHEPVRKALRRLLTADGYDVCGEAADGPDVIDAVRRLRPDAILMDLLMPGMSGIDAAREVHAEFPATMIVLMTSPDPEIKEAALQAGMRGVVWKGSGNFINAIHDVLKNDEFR